MPQNKTLGNNGTAIGTMIADTRGSNTTTRGQTETIGFVLVIGFVILGATVIGGFAFVTIDTTQDRLTESQAETALTQFDSQAALTALGESTTQDTRLGSQPLQSDSFSVDEDAGWVELAVTSRDTGTTIATQNISLGRITYQNGNNDVRLGYQAGGVWRVDTTGGQMVSPPEFSYRDATLTLPIITITEDTQRLSGEITADSGRVQRLFPNADTTGVTNPLTNARVTVTVHSQFYRAWADYFEARTDSRVSVDDANTEVTAVLVSEVDPVTIRGPSRATTPDGKLLIQANPHNPCGGGQAPHVDAYNSAVDGYCEQFGTAPPENTGTLTFGGDIVTAAGSGEIRTDLRSGGELRLAGQMDYYGNLTHTAGCTITTGGGPNTNCEAIQPDGYTTTQISGVQTTPQIDTLVTNRLQTLRNTATDVTLRDSQTITAGEYYTPTIDLTGDTVRFDTSAGDITLGVANGIHLTGNSELHVVGDGEVSIFALPDADGTGLQLTQSKVTAPNDNATKLTIFGPSRFNSSIVDQSVYTGVLYAPTGTTGAGQTIIDRRGTVYGSTVTGDLVLGRPRGGNGGSLHYDTQLREKTIQFDSATIIPVTYLHVTQNEIVVSGD